MEDQELFDCKKYDCRLTVNACIERRKAFKESRGRYVPVYPECQDCSQYDKVGKIKHHSILEKVINHETIKHTGGKRMSRNKIDNQKLKQLIADGKFNDEIAEAFGCVDTAVSNRIKSLGLTPNYRRHRRSPDGTVSAPVVIKPVNPATIPVAAIPQQIIPVTLSLTLEVNVRVNTAA